MIEENLDISDCHEINWLPENLTLRNFKLSRCYSLKKLPSGLDVSTLNLHDCTGLSALPKDMKIRGDMLAIEGCISILSIPDIQPWLDGSETGQVVDFFMGGAGFLREDICHLSDTPSVRIHYFENGVQEGEWKDRFGQKKKCEYLNLPVFSSKHFDVKLLDEYRTIMGDEIRDPCVLVHKEYVTPSALERKSVMASLNSTSNISMNRKLIEQGPFSYSEFMRNWLEHGRGLYHNHPIENILGGRLQRIDIKEVVSDTDAI